MRDAGIVVAIRKADFDGMPPGAVESKCMACDAAVVLARPSQRKVEQGYEVYCGQCIEGALRRQPDAKPQIELPTRAEMAEANAWRNRH